ncbi:restriction endonuclease subunit S [Enterococcus faecium]|uniref:Type I restriction modification DNA specificity domain-containing protein n=1 Tax=Enterococcus faecium TaxID=1352 RepID=A0A242BCJ6_ENTFC|nr:restriction endonuclease subunit S [Enterococcus faecium]OTN93078.1 hypothetical protein A5810_002537 [Enterococcus faecium]
MSNNTQPEIRFPGFTEAWEQRKLGELTESFDGKRVPIDSDLRISGKYPYYGATGIIDYVDDYIFNGEYVLLAEDGANIIMRNYPVAYLTQGKFWLNNHAHIMRMRNGSNYFLVQVLEKIDYKKYNTGTAQPKLNSKIVKNIELKIPHIEEQQQIGNFFKQLDDIIALHQRKLDLLKETKKGFLQKMFPKNGAKVPEVRFPGFTEAWEERKVGEIFKVTRGQVLAATETSESITEKNIYPVYSSQTKNDGLMGYYSDYLFDTAITWTTDGANAGTVNYRNGKFYSTNVNGVLLSDKGYANKAVAEIINRIAWKHVSKVGNPKLMNNVMSEITITIPSVEEQETISRFFTQLDSTITLHERELDLLKETKKGFLQKMFV